MKIEVWFRPREQGGTAEHTEDRSDWWPAVPRVGDFVYVDAWDGPGDRGSTKGVVTTVEWYPRCVAVSVRRLPS